ncbi:MAG TPA: hypothetical protein VJ739_13205 [Gemmataceae bacterium]|nr:hypothetical protein [Gemmataceae bacterium]
MFGAVSAVEEGIRTLPRWGRVAFAARCGRRVQPLLRRFWKNPPPEVLDVFERAVTAAEQSAATAGSVEGLGEALQAAERYVPAMAGLPPVQPYGSPAARIRPTQLLRHAVASTALAAVQAAEAAGRGEDDLCAEAAWDAYGWAVHAANLVHVTGLDLVLESDLRALQQAQRRGDLAESTPASPDFFALERELRTYRRELPGLLGHAEGKYVVIHGDRVNGVWETYEDALQAGYERYQLNPFLVKQICAREDLG